MLETQSDAALPLDEATAHQIKQEIVKIDERLFHDESELHELRSQFDGKRNELESKEDALRALYDHRNSIAEEYNRKLEIDRLSLKPGQRVVVTMNVGTANGVIEETWRGHVCVKVADIAEPIILRPCEVDNRLFLGEQIPSIHAQFVDEMPF